MSYYNFACSFNFAMIDTFAQTFFRVFYERASEKEKLTKITTRMYQISAQGQKTNESIIPLYISNKSFKRR